MFGRSTQTLTPEQALLRRSGPRVMGLPLPDLRRWPVSSIIILGLFVIAAVGADWISPYELNEGELGDRHIRPMFFGGTAAHVLGTDYLGRDILTRAIHGARISLMVAAVVLGVGGLFGTVIGMISGYFGGWVDEIIMRIVDIKFSLPFILIALALALIFGPSLPLLLGLLAFLIWGGFARQVRGEVLVLKEMDYVALCQGHGSLDYPYPLQAHPPGRAQYDSCRRDNPGRQHHPRRSVAQLPRRRSAAADTGMGLHGRPRPAVRRRRMVGQPRAQV